MAVSAFSLIALSLFQSSASGQSEAFNRTPTQQEKFPTTDVFACVEAADGRLRMRPEGVSCFAGDLPEDEQRLVWATHCAPAADLFARNAEGVAWRSKPSRYIVANQDRTVHPDLERFLAERVGATTTRSTAATYQPRRRAGGDPHRRDLPAESRRGLSRVRGVRRATFAGR
jgi:hypothetical protein